MSSAVTNSASHKDATDRAKAAFTRLPHNDAILQQCISNQQTVHSVLQILCENGAAYKRKTSTRLLERFHRCTAWMTNISDSVDMAVQSSAGIACPLWAPIKFVLRVSQDYVCAAEHILNVIQMLSDNLPRLDLYKRFHDEPRFQIVLLDLFADVTEFAVHAYRFFSRRLPLRLGRLIGRSFKDEFGDIISRIETRTKNVDSMAIAMSQERAAQFFQESQARLQQESRIRSMQWLRPSNVRECNRRHLALKVDKTCEWILDHPKFQNWTEPDPVCAQGRVLIIHGPAGCGKSVLGSFIHDTFQQGQQRQLRGPFPVYFSFSASDADRRTLDSLARTLLSQLLEHDQEGKLIPFFNALMERGPMSTSEMFDALNEAISLLSRSVQVIIDGIDECSDSKDGPADYLCERLCTQPYSSLVVLGKSHAFSKLLGSTPHVAAICISSGLISDDIEAVVDTELQRFTSLSSTTRDAVSTSLLAKADGMFLWVRLMFDYLRSAPCEEDIMARLTDLPQGLAQSYHLILYRLLGRLDKHQQRLVCSIFSFTVSAGQPLDFEQLRYAYALATRRDLDSAPSNLERFLLRLQPEEIVDLCGGLLSFVDGHFRLIHNSAREYLTRPAEEWDCCETQQIRVFRVDPPQSHCLFGDICLSYLAEVDYNELKLEQVPSLDVVGSTHPFLLYACLHVAYHFNRSNKSLDQLRQSLSALLESDQCFFALEYLVSFGLSDSSVHAQVETWILVETLSRGHGTVLELFPSLKSRLEKEYAKRSSRSGESTPRMTHGILGHDAVYPLQEQSRSHETWVEEAAVGSHRTHLDAVDPVEQEHRYSNFAQLDQQSNTTCSGAVPNSRPSLRLPHRADSLIARPDRKGALEYGSMIDLLQNSLMAPLGHQFQLIYKLLQHFIIPRSVVDPLEALWQLVQRKATTISTLHLAAITLFFNIADRNEEAFELGNICLRRLGDQDSKLKAVLRHLMGYVTSNLDMHDVAIEHFAYALPKEQSFLGDMRYILFDANLRMADCYDALQRYGDAFVILKQLIGDNSTYRRADKKLKLRAYYRLAENLYESGSLQEAFHAYTDFLRRHRDVFGDFTKVLASEVLTANFRIATLHFEFDQDDEALRAVQQYQSLAARFRDAFEIAEYESERIGAIVLREDLCPTKKSRESARAGLQDCIAENCKALGWRKCSEMAHSRYNAIDYMGVLRRTIPIYEEFLDACEAAHSERELLDCHPGFDPIHGDNDLAQLYQKANRHHDAVQLLQRFLKFPWIEENYNKAVLLINLSDSESSLGNHLLAARTAREASKLINSVADSRFPDIPRLKREIHRAVQVHSCKLRQFGPYADFACCAVKDYGSDAEPWLNLRPKKSTLSLLSRGSGTRETVKTSTKNDVDRSLEALLLLQHQEYLDEELHPEFKPPYCSCQQWPL